jgi:hypothetical protein
MNSSLSFSLPPFPDKKCCYTLENSISNNHLDCFQNLHSQKDFKITSDIIASIADTGNLQLMQYVYNTDKSDLKFNKYLTAISCINNDINMLQFLVENGCHIDEWALVFAILEHNSECLKYAINNNFVFNKTAMNAILNQKSKNEINDRYPEFANKKEYDWRKKYSNLLVKVELFRLNK